MSRPERKNRQEDRMGEKSNENIVCPVPVKPVDFGRIGLEDLQPPQRRHRLPQSSRMPPMDQQQQQKQMLANQAHWNQVQRQKCQIAHYTQMLTDFGLRQPSSFWEQALLQNSQSQQGQQLEQGQQAQRQQIQQHEQGVAEFHSNVLQTHELIPLMAPGVQGDCPEDTAMQLEQQLPYFDEAQPQQALEFDLFPSPSMDTLPDNWEQQPHLQANSEEADNGEPFQFFDPNADQMNLQKPRRQQAQVSAPQLISHTPGTHEEAQRMWKLDQLQNGSLTMTPEEAQLWAEQSLCKW